MKKSAIIALTALCFAVACNKFDDSAIWEKLNDHENRIVYLEEVCRKMNTDIVNLQTIITALESNDNIVSVSPLATGDGYTFTFSSGKSIVIYSGVNGQDGTDGKDGVDGKDGIDGKDGVTPVISVMKDTDGVYYWTVNGEWLLVNGNKVKASAEDGEDGTDGITPQFKIEDDYWYVSYDNGASWNSLGKASGLQGDSYFSEVSVNDHFVVFVLKDGTEITIPKNSQGDMSLELLVFSNVASFSGMVNTNSPDIEVGIIYSYSPDVKVQNSTKISTYDFDENGGFNLIIRDLDTYSTVYYRSYIYMNGLYSYSDVETFETEGEPANCYLISEPGSYGFPAVKGNSTESVGDVSFVEVLWESFGTSTAPSVGDLIKSATYDNGCVFYTTADAFKEGNAVIAAKDADSTILWSWHIWLTDKPEDCVLYNNVGTIMDRNLGATSATPGDVRALGLLYQFGRKDPFLGSSSINGVVSVNSTSIWPEVSAYATLDYAIENPMTFIQGSLDYDSHPWCSGCSTMWDIEKTIYDPCPVGYRIPNNFAGCELNVDWYDSANKGMGFYDNILWFPMAGQRTYSGSLKDVGVNGYYWSFGPSGAESSAKYLYFNSTSLNTSKHDYYDYYFGTYVYRAAAKSVRCQKEE